MIHFTTIIERFAKHGEKSGWTYIVVPIEITEKLFPGNRKAFRVKGKLDGYCFEGISLLPMGEGDFIMALNGTVRKVLKKEKGARVEVELELDNQEKPLSTDFLECLKDEPKAFHFFQTLPKGHQRYFSNWIQTAKTDATKTKRIAQAINALSMNFGFGEMIRMNKKDKFF